MKNFKIQVLALLFILIGFQASAQNEDNPWQITVGMNAIDVYPVGGDAPQGDLFSDYFNVDGHWNIVPALSTISISKYLSDNFSFGVDGSFNILEKWGTSPLTNETASVDRLKYFSVGGSVKYSFAELFNSSKLEPFGSFGGGYTWVEEGPYNASNSETGVNNLMGTATANAALGLSYWMNDNFAFTFQSTYKHSFRDYVPTHFQHSLGVSVNFGGKDTDGDGIYDKKDACPEVPGLEAFNGCPDSDGDGIQDSEDACPQLAGLEAYNGCPDTDNDGVSDDKDNCPNEAGVAALNGCPDSDNDGVANADDKCPNEAGDAANGGCPWPDTDGDSVLDKDDKCPNEAGTVANNGCPEVPSEEVQATLASYARTINFDTGKSNIKSEATETLNAIVAILKEYPKANFVVEGHTDSTASKSFNQKLSEQRAAVVVDFLVSNGVDAARLSSVGYGETSPISSNETALGRATNRRVEVKLAN